MRNSNNKQYTIMKYRKMIVMFLIALFAIPSTAMAQNRINKPTTNKTAVNRNKHVSNATRKAADDASISFSCRLYRWKINDVWYDGENAICHFKMYDFGKEGKTVMVETPEYAKINNIEKLVWSWSGINITLVPAKQYGALDGYAIVRGDYPLGTLVKYKEGWIFDVETKDHLISDIYPGMTLTQVKNKINEFVGSQFKETGKSGGYTIWTLYGPDIKKNYHWNGNYDYKATNDKPYGRFFFDSNSKLHKWIQYYQ